MRPQFLSVAILAQEPFLVRTCAVFFLRHERFWFGLVQVSTTQFCSFSPVLMASVDDASDVPISPMPGTSSNYGSPNGSGLDLNGIGYLSIDAQFTGLRDI